jgi:hypothetical protein
LKKLVGRTDIEDALQRLEHMTQEEIRMANAETFKTIHDVDNKVGDRTDGVQDALQAAQDKIEDMLQDVTDILQGVDDRVKDISDKVVNGAQIVQSPMSTALIV